MNTFRNCFFLASFCFLSGLLSAQDRIKEEVNNLNEQAFEAYDREDYQTAIQYGKKALSILEDNYPDSDTDVIIMNLNLGGFYQQGGEYKRAEQHMKKSRELYGRYLSRKDPEYVNICSQYGGLLEQMDRLFEAEAVLKEGYDISHKMGDNKSDIYSILINNYSIVLKKMHRYVESAKLASESLKLTGEVFGKGSPDYARALNNYGALLSDMGNFALSRTMYMQAERIHENNGTTGGSSYGTLLNNMATLESESGDPSKAKSYYHQAAEIAKRIHGEQSMSYALNRMNLAAVEAELGNYREAEKLFTMARSIYASILGPRHIQVFEVDLRMAEMYRGMGNYNKGGKLYDLTLPLMKEALGETSPDYLTYLQNAAIFYQEIEKFDVADRYFQQILKHLDKFESQNLHYSVLHNYGQFLDVTGKADQGFALYLQALKGFEKLDGKQSPDYANVLNSIGTWYVNKQNWDSARVYLKQSIQLNESLFGEMAARTYQPRMNLAYAYYSSGNHTLASEIYRSVKQVVEKSKGKENLSYTEVLYNLALCEMKTGSYEKSVNYMEEGLAIKRRVLGENHPLLSDELQLLATAYTYSGDYKKGETYYHEAKTLIVSNYNTYFRFMTENEKLLYTSRNTSRLKQLQAIALDKVHDYPDFASMALDIELVLKGLVLNSTGQIRREAERNPKLKEKYNEWTELKIQLARELSKPQINRRDDFSDLLAKSDKLEKEIISALGEKNAELVSDISWKEIQSKLKQDELLIEFISYRNFKTDVPGTAALLLRSSGSPIMVNLYDDERLNNYLSQHRGKGSEQTVTALYTNGLRGAEETGEGQQQVKADSLYHYILQPLETYLRDVRSIYYSPAGSLNKISFAAITINGSEYFSSRFNLTCLSSGRLLLTQPSDLKIKDALLVGGVNYNTSTEIMVIEAGKNVEDPNFALAMRANNGNSWTYLPGTIEEANDIQKLFAANKVSTTFLSGDHAVEENVKSISVNGPPDIVHIATHGYFFADQAINITENANPFSLSDNPMLRSGLILTGANHVWSGGTAPNGIDDGILTAYEAANLDLNGTRLVVLSACETGLGDIQGSEGVFGLQRAFKQAGAEYIVMSLWQVPDQETREFMKLFYDQLFKGETIPHAFNLAQDSMKKKYDPFYWAAFVLIR